MVNSIRAWLYITYRLRHYAYKEAENRHLGKYSDAKTAVISSRSSKVMDFGTNLKHVYTFL